MRSSDSKNRHFIKNTCSFSGWGAILMNKFDERMQFFPSADSPSPILEVEMRTQISLNHGFRLWAFGPLTVYW